MTGIPVVNVNNNCSTGSTALFLAAQAVRGGMADCALALGFEKMQPGSLGVDATTTVEQPMMRHLMALAEICRNSPMPPAPYMFGARRRASTWSATAPPPSSSPRSASRTTSTR